MPGALDKSVLENVLLAVEQSTYVGESALTATTRLKEDLGLRRFGFLKLAVYLEEIFEVELSDEALGRCSTVADVVKYLTRYCLDFDLPSFATGTSQPPFGAQA